MKKLLVLLLLLLSIQTPALTSEEDVLPKAENGRKWFEYVSYNYTTAEQQLKLFSGTLFQFPSLSGIEFGYSLISYSIQKRTYQYLKEDISGWHTNSSSSLGMGSLLPIHFKIIPIMQTTPTGHITKQQLEFYAEYYFFNDAEFRSIDPIDARQIFDLRSHKLDIGVSYTYNLLHYIPISISAGWLKLSVRERSSQEFHFQSSYDSNQFYLGLSIALGHNRILYDPEPGIIRPGIQRNRSLEEQYDQLLKSISNTNSESFLFRCLSDSNFTIRNTAASRMVQLIIYSNSESFLFRCLSDTNFTIRNAAASRMAQLIINSNSEKFLLRCMADEDSVLRQTSVKRFASLMSTFKLEKIIDYSTNDISGVREDAANALAKIDDPRAVTTLLKLMKDNVFCVSFSAFEALKARKEVLESDSLISILLAYNGTDIDFIKKLSERKSILVIPYMVMDLNNSGISTSIHQIFYDNREWIIPFLYQLVNNELGKYEKSPYLLNSITELGHLTCKESEEIDLLVTFLGATDNQKEQDTLITVLSQFGSKAKKAIPWLIHYFPVKDLSITLSTMSIRYNSRYNNIDEINIVDNTSYLKSHKDVSTSLKSFIEYMDRSMIPSNVDASFLINEFKKDWPIYNSGYWQRLFECNRYLVLYGTFVESDTTIVEINLNAPKDKYTFYENNRASDIYCVIDGLFALKYLAKLNIGAYALSKITGLDFGNKRGDWLIWWKDNKNSYLGNQSGE